MNDTYHRKTIRNLLIFSLVVLICGWIGRIVDLKVGMDATGSLGKLIWLVSPLLIMIVLRSFMGDGWKDFGFKPNFRRNLFLYTFCILFVPISTVIIILIGYSLELVVLSNLNGSILSAFSLALFPMFVKNIFEEFAWRGYLAPKLFAYGMSRIGAHLVVGVIWAVWHIPYLVIITQTKASLLFYIPQVMLGLIILSVIYGEIRYVTNSVWPAVILHTMTNAIADTIILNKYIDIRDGYEYLVTPSPEGILTIVTTGLVGLWLYKRNSKINILTNSNSFQGK
jgi:membrane protease YdiL (CAAX protease family)